LPNEPWLTSPAVRVVVLVAQAAHHLSGHLTWAGLREFAAVFTLTWIAWLNGSLHHELHGREEARGRSVFLLQIMVLVPLGAFIPEAVLNVCRAYIGHPELSTSSYVMMSFYNPAGHHLSAMKAPY
jgi:hypothetical protein